ncbi:hypothetical protein CPB84DRAFT_1791118 [Gymnopilus junonius]|uniref:Uncharacterized protein n=1 Tax=Gymnopilus junonius TaxID=109634 RepID=A0A9P5NE43_GYMJU|nr:hypothetical protein CPB84DRAFT_1791118 [Gymnopilus junonius]
MAPQRKIRGFSHTWDLGTPPCPSPAQRQVFWKSQMQRDGCETDQNHAELFLYQIKLSASTELFLDTRKGLPDSHLLALPPSFHSPSNNATLPFIRPRPLVPCCPRLSRPCRHPGIMVEHHLCRKRKPGRPFSPTRYWRQQYLAVSGPLLPI